MAAASNAIATNVPSLIKARPDDVAAYARSFAGWSLHMHQLSAGPFRADLTTLTLDHVQLVRERTLQALWKEGGIEGRTIVLCVPLRLTGPAYLNGHLIAFPDPVLLDGRDLPPVLTPCDLDVVTLVFDRTWLLQALDLVGEREALGALVRGRPQRCLDRANASAVRSLLLDLFEDCDRVQRVLSFVEARRALEHELLLALVQTIASSEHRSVGFVTPQRRVADRVRERLLACVDETPSIAELCDHVGVSRRNLQVCFQSAFGMAPGVFLRTARLNAVRQELLALSRSVSQPSIGDIAARWGFWHWSRFAAQYRALFGERPSDTCRRAATAR